jgi:hypothetical protein
MTQDWSDKLARYSVVVPPSATPPEVTGYTAAARDGAARPAGEVLEALLAEQRKQTELLAAILGALRKLGAP